MISSYAVSLELKPDQAVDLRMFAENLRSAVPKFTYRNKDIGELTSAAERPPCVADIVAFVRSTIARAPYAAILRGLPIDITPLLLLDLSYQLGEVTTGSLVTDALVLRELRPITDVRFGQRAYVEHAHTDGTSQERPNDITVLGCVAPDQHGGGANYLISVDYFREQLSTEVSDCISDVDFPWGIETESGSSIHYAKILDTKSNTIRWHRDCLDQSRRMRPGIINRDSSTAIDRLANEVDTMDPSLIVFLEKGDVIFFDNRKCLHGRSSIPFPELSRRVFYRTKLFAA